MLSSKICALSLAPSVRLTYCCRLARTASNTATPASDSSGAPSSSSSSASASASASSSSGRPTPPAPSSPPPHGSVTSAADAANYRHRVNRRDFRFIFPEFLPDPEPKHRNHTVERLARRDMIRRRNEVEIPEFYVGSIVSVTTADENSPSSNKTSRFVGIVIARGGSGLNAWKVMWVRNVIDHQGIEFIYNLYAPTVLKIETLRLEKRLDDELYYLRDAPQQYSAFPQDMEMEILPEGVPVPVNDIVVPLNPQPWGRNNATLIIHDLPSMSFRRWEFAQMTGRLKGYSYNRIGLYLKPEHEKKAGKFMLYQHPGWHFEVAKYDLLLQYTETIPVEEQDAIWREVGDALEERDKAMRKVAAKRAFVKPEKQV